MKCSGFFSVSSKLTLALLAVVIILFPQATGRWVAAHDSDYVRIDIEKDGFKPVSISIQAGVTVEWRNKEHEPHTVNAQSATFNSGIISKDDIYQYTFSTPGTYTYTDRYAPFTGTITVLGSSSAPPPAPLPVSVSTPNPAPLPSPSPSAMSIGDNFFTPGSSSIAAGTTVTWTNAGQKPHTVTSDDGLFDSGMLSPGQSFSFSFQSPGSYSYHCIFHNGQAGTITVTGSSNATSNVVATPPPPPAPTPTPVPSPILGGSGIQIGDNMYSPVGLSLVAGTTVTWTNAGQKPHTVTSDDGLFDSGILMPGQSFSFSFQSPRTYSYHCILHSGQAGTITVTGSGNSLLPIQTVPIAPSQVALPSKQTPVQSPAAVPAGIDIKVGDNVYTPAQLPLVTGGTVTWTNTGNFPHTVTSDTGLFDSGMLKPGQSFSFSFQSPGSYAYHCVYHSGQAGAILVSDSGSSPPAVLSPQEHGNAHIILDSADTGKTSPGDQPMEATVGGQQPRTGFALDPKVFVAIAALVLLMGGLTAFAMMKKPS
ncbi:MAG: cupredoxin domain-containing protein [Chloroflexi bacterium]|nr:cupredoxin domain-containing protein [Chloroflexota bacterium]